MVDDAWMAAVEHAQEVDGIGKVARHIGAAPQDFVGKIGVGGAALLRNARGQPLTRKGGARRADRS
jgi:hypothetical protein